MQKISNGYLVVEGIINTQSLRLLGKYMRRGRRGLGITMFKVSNFKLFSLQRREGERNIVCLRQISRTYTLCPGLLGTNATNIYDNQYKIDHNQCMS